MRHRRSIPISRTLWRMTKVLPFGRAKQATSQSVPEEALRVRMRIRGHVSFPLVGTPEYIVYLPVCDSGPTQIIFARSAGICAQHSSPCKARRETLPHLKYHCLRTRFLTTLVLDKSKRAPASSTRQPFQRAVGADHHGQSERLIMTFVDGKSLTLRLSNGMFAKRRRSRYDQARTVEPVDPRCSNWTSRCPRTLRCA